jgi:hypothetical protein
MRVAVSRPPQLAEIAGQHDWAERAGREVLFARASPGARAVVLRETGQWVAVGKDRAFLFVLPEQRSVTVDERE